MKKTHLMSLALAAVGIIAFTTGRTLAEEAAVPTPNQIGLIDMAYIFKNYEKFKDQTSVLQNDAQQAEAKAQKMMEQGQQATAQLKTLQAGSDDYNRIESELIRLKNELETFRQKEQREIVRKQAEAYKEIYLEVQDIVNRYASHFKYTLIIRFNREDVANAENPQAIIQNMNRQVVYYQPQDDITQPILDYLNSQYKKTAATR